MPTIYFEILPTGCPHADATTVDNEKYYRLVATRPVKDTDFYSHKKLGKWNTNNAKVNDECIACAISIWKNLDKCSDLRKIAANKSKEIVEITLFQKDGPVKQTLSPDHYSWWRSNEFSLTENIAFQ